MEINKRQGIKYLSSKPSTLIFAMFVFVSSFNVYALTTNDAEPPYEEGKLNKTTVEYYQKDNITNQIPYFDNRFRIDAQLEEITLIFYRKIGSTPIILIRPDGSKIRVNHFDHDKVQWFDDSTFDMIRIKKPMPGPWQAVGDILPNSQILVMSEVNISVEPLPEIAFSGETLKVEGKLFNGKDRISTPHFKHVVHLDVNFYSTNNSRYDNFGADAIKVTSFRDDGRGLDEYSDDNIFTGEFILDFAPGEWQPVYLVKLPMETRELRQTPILVQKTPVAISVTKSEDENIPHQLLLTIDPSFVDPSSLVFQGKFTFPDRQVEAFSIMDSTGLIRSKPIANTEPGLYRINVSAFGKTTNGREFRLVVPEFSFNIEEKDIISAVSSDLNITDTTELSSTDMLLVKAEEEQAAALLSQQQIQDEKEEETIILIVAGNSVIIMIAVIVFFSLRRKKPKANKH